MNRRPRIVFLADEPCWAFDFVARSIALRLGDRFDPRVAYVRLRPRLDPGRIDLLYVFFWGETYHQQFGFPPEKVVKEVASLRWLEEERYRVAGPAEFVERYLGDCRWVTTPARRIFDLLAPPQPRLWLCPNGYEPALFHPPAGISGGGGGGPLRVGWVGDPDDPCKGLHDVLAPACRGRHELRATSGRWSRQKVARLYRQVDVIAIASTNESQPLPLIEGMASGCFPVATDVGLVPQFVRSGENGLIVERSPAAFAEALDWCAAHLHQVRAAGRINAALMRQTRGWDRWADRFAAVFEHVLAAGRGAPPQDAPPPPALADDPPVDHLAEVRARLEHGGPTARERGAISAPAGGAPARSAWRWRLSDLWHGRVRPTVAELRRDGPLRFLVRRLTPLSWRRAVGKAFTRPGEG